MWIEQEPGDMLMMRYMLCFEPGDPNPEDRQVRAYLRGHKLEPKRIWDGERSGVKCQVLQFGQCYLGAHLGVLHGMRYRGIVAEATGAWLRDIAPSEPLLEGLDGAAMQDLAWTLAGVALEKDAARADEQNPMRTLLDVDILRAELPAAVGALTADAPAMTNATPTAERI
jgi:hypothetical protein